MSIDWNSVPTIVVGFLLAILLSVVILAALAALWAAAYALWSRRVVAPPDVWRFEPAEERTSSNVGGKS